MIAPPVNVTSRPIRCDLGCPRISCGCLCHTGGVVGEEDWDAVQGAQGGRMGLLVRCWLKGGLCLGFGRLTVLFLLLVGRIILAYTLLFFTWGGFSLRLRYSD